MSNSEDSVNSCTCNWALISKKIVGEIYVGTYFDQDTYMYPG